MGLAPRFLVASMIAGALAGGAPLFAQGMGSGVKSQARPSPKSNAKVPTPRLDFRDITASTGITAVNVYGGEKSKRYILEMTGNGAAIFDYDNDGWRDVFLASGMRLEHSREASDTGGRLYRNKGRAVFEDVTEAAGLLRKGWGQGACAGDFDNDGHTDLLATYYGQNALFRNLGSGRFEDVAEKAGLVVKEARWSTNCSFLDYDRDGLLDIFYTTYLAVNLKEIPPPGSTPYCAWRGLSVFCGPRGFPTGKNFLYHNEGEGRFRDVTSSAGIAQPELHYNLGAVTADFNNDGWPDIHVASDSTPGILYRNNKDGTFTDEAVMAGVAYGDAGQELGSMGTSAGDYDNDGWIDIVKSNFMDETPTLYRNRGKLLFEDATYLAGLGVNIKFVGWGVDFLDADQDGWKDILFAHGHIYPELQGSETNEPFRQRKALFWNIRNGAFRDVTALAGAALMEPNTSRGFAIGDLDGDGRPEVVVVNMNARPTVIKNSGDTGNALLIELVGTKSNRSAIGTRVSVTAAGLEQIDEVRSGGGYASQRDFRLHFGVGPASTIDTVRVRWPSGVEEEFSAVAANQWITIREGGGIVRRTTFP